MLLRKCLGKSTICRRIVPGPLRRKGAQHSLALWHKLISDWCMNAAGNDKHNMDAPGIHFFSACFHIVEKIAEKGSGIGTAGRDDGPEYR